MFVLANMWFQTLMRQFFFNIDKIVFNFISTIYDFLITIARTSVLSQADIASMADRIYKLLAVFMIFKVTFSLIMYVVNPDDFSDKSKGVGKLGTNVVISLSLLILTPYIFNYAYQLQTIILEDNALSALIFGESQENTNQAPFESAGDKMAYITMQPFFMPNSAIDELYECAQLTTRDSNGNVIFNKDCSGLDLDYASTNDADSLYALTKNEDGEENTRFTEQTLKNYIAGVSVGNLGLMFRQDMAIATDSENTEFIIDYKYLFSTVLGIVIILLLVTFCMDVALRSIKLAFLQLIAPIPIISFVDPKSGKDGMFKKWAEMCGKTYISLFIRLLAIYFAAFIISKIDRMVDIVDGSYVSNLLVKIFIIIGALMFAKQLPKILEGLGVKLDGGFTLNPLKKMENEMIGGKQVSKVGKGVGKYTGRLAKGVGTAALVGGASAITGHGFRGTGKAIRGAWKGDKFGQNFSNSYGAAKDRHRQVEQMKSEEINPFDVWKANLYNKTHGMTKQERNKSYDGRMDAITKSWDSIAGTIDAVDQEAKTLKAKVEGIRQAGTSQFKDITLPGGRVDTADAQYQRAIKAAEDALDTRRKNVANDLSLLNDGTTDGSAGGQAARVKISQEIKTRNDNIDFINNQKITYETPDGSTRTIKIDKTKDVKSVSKAMQGEQGAWKASNDYRQAEAISNYTKQKKS